MQRYGYIVEQDDDGSYLIRFPDVPEALTSADSKDVIEAEALSALVTALAGYALEGRAFPRPRKTDKGIIIPALLVAKLELIATMAAAKMSNIELARRLGVDEKAVRRLTDFDHRSHIGQVEVALAALGRRLEVSIKAA